jgi:ribosomal protein S18 acetylase RimI-like enzyme
MMIRCCTSSFSNYIQQQRRRLVVMSFFLVTVVVSVWHWHHPAAVAATTTATTSLLSTTTGTRCAAFVSHDVYRPSQKYCRATTTVAIAIGTHQQPLHSSVVIPTTRILTCSLHLADTAAATTTTTTEEHTHHSPEDEEEAVTESSSQQQQQQLQPHNYQIRDCQHTELHMIADIIIDSFYNYGNTTTANPGGLVWKQLSKLAELNRLQQNFPYNDDRARHRMMILTTTSSSTTASTSLPTTTICGFVDIDARTPNRPTSYTYNPRPYVSDLCIHPHYRRLGYATVLVQACEDFCRFELPTVMPRQQQQQHQQRHSDPTNDQPTTTTTSVPELYIRVEATNTAALQMYHNLGYNIVQNHSDAADDTILILHKLLFT